MDKKLITPEVDAELLKMTEKINSSSGRDGFTKLVRYVLREYKDLLPNKINKCESSYFETTRYNYCFDRCICAFVPMHSEICELTNSSYHSNLLFFYPMTCFGWKHNLLCGDEKKGNHYVYQEFRGIAFLRAYEFMDIFEFVLKSKEGGKIDA